VEYRSVKALRPLLDYLAPLGVLPVPQEVRLDAVEELLCRFRDYLFGERGLTAGTVRGYVDCVRPFVAGRARGDVLDLAGVTAADVTGFVLAACPGRAVGSAKLIVCALRSLLGWLHVTGAVPVSLAAAVPSVAGWRLSGLPKGLEPAQLRRLLASCDRRTLTGRRDYAIMLLLSRLGLRAGEVAVLGLDDIDWRRGEIAILGKGNRSERLPMPGRCGRGDRGVSAMGSAGQFGGAQRVRARPRTAPGVDERRGDDGRLRCRAARRSGQDIRASAAAHRRHRDAAGRQPTGRGRAGAAAPLAVDDGDLRQGRPGRARRARPALAGRGRGWCVVTGPLREQLADYLALRRALGYRLARPEKLLGQFLDHLERAGESRITVHTALDWARLPATGGSNWWAYRLSTVRGFAAYLHALDPAHEVPAAELLPHRPLGPARTCIPTPTSPR
jgi:integrase